jgi:hypothetical protein
LAVRGCRFESAAPATSTPAATLVAAAATAAAQPLALFGLLALPTSVQVGNAVQSFQPVLREAVFGDNDFVNLTLPLLAVADDGAMRLEGNRVRGCLGGFWLEAADAVDPPDPTDGAGVSWRACYAAAGGFAEVRTGFSVGQSYLWPAGLDQATLQAWVQAPRAAAPLGLAITDNRVEAVLPGPAAGGPGLTLALNRPQGTDTAAALVVAGNEVRVSSAGPAVPAVLLSVAGGPTPTGPAALTGNLLVNTGPGPPPSLLIFPGGGTQNVVGLAVTGNVLVGPTNLGDLNLPPPLTTWVGSNAVYPPPAAPAPVVAGLSPVTGTANTSVAVMGSGFTGVTQVTFGGVPAVSFRFNSDRLVTAVAPVVPAAATVEVVVWTPNGTSAPLTPGADMFRYTAAPAPAVTGVSPTTGGLAGGYKVIVTGTGFTGATQVKFGTAVVAAGAFTVNSDTSITATAPQAAAPGVVDVSVTTPSGTSAQVAADRFLYVGAPVVTGLTPSFVAGTLFLDEEDTISLGGGPVTIAGSGFTGATQVSFVGVLVPAAQLKVNSDTSVTVTAPVRDLSATVSGDVLVTTPSGTSAAVPADRFSYVVRIKAPPPPPPPHTPQRPGLPRLFPQ